jgi:putative transposase
MSPSVAPVRRSGSIARHNARIPRGREDEKRLTAEIIELARQYGRYGYRKIAELVRQAGWTINDKRVERIWRREGLRVHRSNPSAAGSG